MNAFRVVLASSLAVSVMAISGCTSPRAIGFSDIAFYGAKIDTRVVITNVKTGRVCAEPPPEAGITSDTTMKAILAAANARGDNANAELYRSYAEQLTQLYRRSHSNQMYRDASYYLCQAYINGAISPRAIAAYLETVAEAGTAEDKALIAPLKRKLSGMAELTAADTDGAYLVAQMLLSKMAFASLGTEIGKFYDDQNAVNKYLAEETRPKVDRIIGKLDALGVEVAGIDTTTKDTKALVKPVADNVAVSNSKVDAVQQKANEILEAMEAGQSGQE